MVEAIYRKHSTQDNLNFPKSVDIDKIPVNEGYSEAHKELINQYKSLLTRDTDEQKISKLLHHAADLQLRADFESLYNIIFGSQIQALQTLSANKNIDLTPFYQTHCERTDLAEAARLASFDLWIQLLKHYGLVTEDSNKYSLSNKGILFLKFLKERNYYLDKAF